MTSPRLPLLVLPFVALAAGAAARRAPSPLSAVRMSARADTDTVIPGGVTQLVILPLPIPDSIKPVRLSACFDLDTLGQPTLLQYNLTRDKDYNKRIHAALTSYRFRPSTRLGVPVRDTICIRAVGGERK